MKAGLVEQARELGFDACRVTDASVPEHAEAFRAWLADGCHGGMEYLARNAEKRVDPQRVLPGARSIVTLAVSYHVPEPAVPEGFGVVARYARHLDYHDLLAPPLKALSGWIDAHGPPGTRTLWYVDTGPLLERDLAQRAGIGFAGKHTNLIARDLGNWFLLAALLTTAPIEPDAPERNRCGHCVRCLESCPTGAIPAPFRLDARRCISYLTIELKGSIPEALRPAIGRRIFGCDDCLEACPWNRFAREGRLMAPHRRADLASPDLVPLLSLDAAEFRRRFAGTPIERTKRRGLLRNVAVALGNVGDRSVLPALARAASDPEPLVAEHASWAMGEIERRHPSA